MATTREIVYRLVAEPDPKYKKVFSDFAKDAVKAQETINKSFQQGAKARADAAAKEVDANRKKEDAAERERNKARDKRNRDNEKAVEKAVRDQERAYDRDQKAHAKALRDKQRAEEKAAKDKEKADEKAERDAERREQKRLRDDQRTGKELLRAHLKRQADEQRIVEDAAKAEIAAQRRLEAARQRAADKSRAAYKDMAEGSVRAGEGVMRIVRAAVLLGGEDENMKKFVQNLAKAQGYFDLYKGVVDIVMGLAKAYRAVAAAAAASAAAQALSAKAGAAGTAGNLGKAATGIAAGGGLSALGGGGGLASGFSLGPAAAYAAMGVVAVGAGVGLGYGINRAMGRDDVGDLWSDYQQNYGKYRNSDSLIRKGRAANVQYRLQQLAGQQESSRMMADVEAREASVRGPQERMQAAEMAVKRAQGRMALNAGVQTDFREKLSDKDADVRQEARRGLVEALQNEVEVQKEIAQAVEDKAKLEAEIRRDRIEGSMKELENSKQVLANAQERVKAMTDAQRTIEERWNRSTVGERQQAIEAFKAIRAGTDTAEQRDLAKRFAGDEWLGTEMRIQEGAQARGSGIQELFDASGFEEEKRRRQTEFTKALEAKVTLDTNIKLMIDADTQKITEAVAKAIKPEMERVASLIARNSSEQAKLMADSNIEDNESAGG